MTGQGVRRIAAPKQVLCRPLQQTRVVFVHIKFDQVVTVLELSSLLLTMCA